MLLGVFDQSGSVDETVPICRLPTPSRMPFPMSPKMPTADDLTVIVCAYTEERWTDIVEAIGSLQAEATPPGEIVLVIDHNNALYERAIAQFPTGVIIVKNTHKNGLSGARNT